jgi:hypothetical protein
MLYRTPIPRKRVKPRRGPLRDPRYREHLRSQRCASCGKYGTRWNPVDPAHTENNGMSSKGDDSGCAPLCRTCHTEYDSGRVEFERRTGLDMKRIARTYWDAYVLASSKRVARVEGGAFDIRGVA